jgi:site-specific DNA recombinase
MMLKKAVAYARYSSDLQRERSIPDQFLVCDKIAKQHGYEIVKRFSDHAISGDSTLERDSFLALMRAAKDQNFDAVIFESLSRVSRDLEDSAGIYKRLTFNNVAMIDIDGTVTSMRVGLSGILNAEFLRNLGNQVRRGWDGRVLEGLTPGRPAYGYRLTGRSCEREIDPETSKIVLRIFEEYAGGEPVREIAARLNRDGIPSPTGVAWNHAVFIAGGGSGRGLIGNRVYIGELIWNGHRTVKNPDTQKRTKRKGKPEDLLVAQVPHLRIVPQELWDRAQALRTNRSRQGSAVYKKTRIKHMLAGKLICGACGGGMKVVWSRVGEDTRIGCGNARNRGICGNSKSYSLPEIEATVLHGIKHNLDVEALMAYTEGAHKEWAAQQRTASAERSAVERALNRTTERIERIVTAIADSDVEIKPLMEKLKALELERAGLADKLRLLGADGNVVTLHPAMIQKFRENLLAMVDALTSKSDAEAAPFRVMFGNAFDRVVVHPTLRPYFGDHGRRHHAEDADAQGSFGRTGSR